MSLWDQTRDHSAWLLSLAAGAAAWLFRKQRTSDKSVQETWSTSWAGRRLNVERENARLVEDLRSLEDSIKRREARWTAERAEMEQATARLVRETTELAQMVEMLRAAQRAGFSPGSAPPLSKSTPPDATLPTSSVTPNAKDSR